jgi:predicted GNAT family N-acyltransferase
MFGSSQKLVDQKIKVLYDKYRDRDIAKNAQKEVEQIRKKAFYAGAISTGAIFVGNELVRLTMRSRILIFLSIY